MSGTTSHALQLLSLLQSRRVWAGPELMDRLEVSERTLRRDIDRLRELGYEVTSVSGPAGGYQLQAGADIPPLLFDEEEATAIAMGLLTAAGGTVAGLEDSSIRALAKLEQVLPPRIRQRLRVLQTAIAPMPRAWVSVNAEVITIVAQACRDSERMRFEYRRRDGEESERHVEPHQLVSIHQRWYLVAYDRDRDDWRTFRVDRMSSPWPTRIGFKPRKIPGGSAAAYLEQSLNSLPMRYEAVATIAASAAYVQERMRGAEAVVEAIDAETCRVVMQGDYVEWLAFQLTWIGAPFEIHEPPELVEYVGALAIRLVDAVS